MPDWSFYRYSGIPTFYLWHQKACKRTLITLKGQRHEVSSLCLVMLMMMYFSCCFFNLEIQFKMPERQTVRHPDSPVPEWKKLALPELVRCQTKLMQSGIFLFQYRTESMDARILMPALVSLMPMPSFDKQQDTEWGVATWNARGVEGQKEAQSKPGSKPWRAYSRGAPRRWLFMYVHIIITHFYLYDTVRFSYVVCLAIICIQEVDPHYWLLFIFRRLKINHDSHEFILESGTVANNNVFLGIMIF